MKGEPMSGKSETLVQGRPPCASGFRPNHLAVSRQVGGTFRATLDAKSIRGNVRPRCSARDRVFSTLIFLS